MLYGISHPTRIRIRGKRPAIRVDSEDRMVVFKEHEHEFGALHKLKRVRVQERARQ